MNEHTNSPLLSPSSDVLLCCIKTLGETAIEAIARIDFGKFARRRNGDQSTHTSEFN
jgi:hypothetical protein